MSLQARSKKPARADTVRIREIKGVEWCLEAHERMLRATERLLAAALELDKQAKKERKKVKSIKGKRGEAA